MSKYAMNEAFAAGWASTIKFAQSIAHRAIEGLLVLGVGVLTWHGLWWSFSYATAALVAKQDAIGTAAVLAAILGPLGALQGFTLAQWMKSADALQK